MSLAGICLSVVNISKIRITDSKCHAVLDIPTGQRR